MAGRKKAGRKEVDLDAMVASGDQQSAYEALQLYRSRAIRFKTKNDNMGAVKMTANGAKCLLENNYETAGAELANLFLELVTEFNMDVNEELKGLVGDIDDRFPKSSTGRTEFLKGCVKWTINCGNRELGDPSMHIRLGDCLWENNDKNASYNYAAGEAPLLLNSRIFQKYPDLAQQVERDQALTVGVTNFLAVENLRDAHELMFAFRKSQDGHHFNAPDSDLVRFCDQLLQTSRRDAAPLFKQLVNLNASKLDFDETVPTLLMGPIAAKLFGIRPKVNPMMSMLQSMLS